MNLIAVVVLRVDIDRIKLHTNVSAAHARAYRTKNAGECRARATETGSQLNHGDNALASYRIEFRGSKFADTFA
jgi:hypothetical protein